MSDMMFDMKTTKPKSARKTVKALPDTFTVRDMSRNAAAVLSASLKYGRVRIRTRSGPAFLLMPEKSDGLAKERAKLAEDFGARQRAYRERLRALGSRPIPPEEAERFNRIIASEE